jgi:transglutaminase-like putative cysteine protease
MAAQSGGVREDPSAVQRYFEVSLFLLVTTGMISIVSTRKLDLLSTIAVPLAIVYKAFRLWRGHGPEISARVATWFVLGYFLFFPLDLWVFSRDRAADAPNPVLYAALLAAIHLLLFATIIRLYSARTNRDYGFLALLAVAAMLASAILTVETGFLVALAVFLAMAVSTFVALEIRRAGAGAVSPPLSPGTPLARRLNRALGGISLLVAFGALAMGGVIFFLIPRFTTGYMSAFDVQPNLVTGFGDDMALGAIGKIQQDPSVVMRVKVDGDASQAADVHWRGIVLTNFDGKRWFNPDRGQTVVMPTADGDFMLNAPAYPPGDSADIHYTVLMEPIATEAIFVAPRARSLRGNFQEQVSRIGSNPRRSFLLIDRTGSIFNSAHSGAKIRYEGTSSLARIPGSELRRASTNYPPEVIGPYLQLPRRLDPRVHELAVDATSRANNPYDKAVAVELYLKSHYAYTLDLRGDPGRDPLAYFLFDRKAGHCEYFASAMAIMLRAIGIPARYATGFLPGEFNDVGGDYIIRSSDAHAWVEAYFPGYGWITFDPTPGGDVVHPMGMMARMAMYWDWFQLAWSEWIVNYDFGHQLRIGESTLHDTRDWTAKLREYYHLKEDQAMRFLLKLDRQIESSRFSLPAVLVFLLVLLLWLRGGALIRYAVARWHLGARRGGNATPSLAIFEYQELLKLLEKRGWRKSPSQTAREFAAAIPATEIAKPVMQFTELYHAARFGTAPAPAEHMSQLLRTIREVIQMTPGGPR